MTGHALAESRFQLSEHDAWVAFAFAAVAGTVDGIAYLLLGVFSSHMSGNTVSMTKFFAAGNWQEAWRHVEPIVAFIAGAVAGVSITDALIRLEFIRITAAIALLEIALLAAFFLVAHPASQWMVFLPASAMGAQNALLRRVGHYRFRTTFITGMIADASEAFVSAVVSALRRDGKIAHELRDFTSYAGIWICFAGGGIASAFLYLHVAAPALGLPIAALAALAARDCASPLAKRA
jgi:uncharacterized membrane protein YoaK (UPF0700 family)